MPRFVILEHDHPHRHWDLMLEAGDTLRTWRLARPPELAVAIEAQALGNHRRAYLDYEGPVSGGRGRVQRWDFGTFTWVEDAQGRLVVDLQGIQCRGRLRIRHVAVEVWEATLDIVPP